MKRCGGVGGAFVHQTLHAFPCPTFATSLTAAAYHVEPQSSHLVDESDRCSYCCPEWRDNSASPWTTRRNQRAVSPKWPVHPLSQFRFDGLQMSHAYASQYCGDGS